MYYACHYKNFRRRRRRRRRRKEVDFVVKIEEQRNHF
jgi:hypothetical protein